MIVLLIIGLIIALGGFALCTLLSGVAKKDNEKEAAAFLSRLRWMIAVPIVLLLAIVLLVSGIRIIDSTEVGVVRTWGQISREIDAGLNLVNPISESVEKYDLRVHVRTAEFASYTKDAQPVDAAVDYQYKLRPGEVMDVAREYGTYEILESKIDSVVEEKVKSVFASLSAMPLLERRSTLSAEVLDSLRDLEDLYHITFTAAVVNNIDFSDAFEASVEAKMTAEQDALRAEQEKKSALVKAEQAKEVAAINAEAAIAQAEGEAEAMRIIREALHNMPDAYIQQLWIEKWNGELPTVSGTDNVIVSVPNVSNTGNAAVNTMQGDGV